MNEGFQNVLLLGLLSRLCRTLKQAQVHWNKRCQDEGTNPQIRQILKLICACLQQNGIVP